MGFSMKWTIQLLAGYGGNYLHFRKPPNRNFHVQKMFKGFSIANHPFWGYYLHFREATCFFFFGQPPSPTTAGVLPLGRCSRQGGPATKERPQAARSARVAMAGVAGVAGVKNHNGSLEKWKKLCFLRRWWRPRNSWRWVTFWDVEWGDPWWENIQFSDLLGGFQVAV